MPDFEAAREQMVARHIAGRGLTAPGLLRAFGEVPRELFVGPRERARAYDDSPLPIAAGQTISQPYIVALMIARAGVRPGQRILEVGAGSGYAAAVLSRIAASVVAIEQHAELARLAHERLRQLGYDDVRIVHGDGAFGLRGASFDAIIVSAAGREVPEALLRQLRAGGVLVMPIGAPLEVQQLIRISRTADGGFEREELGQVRFVPLVTER